MIQLQGAVWNRQFFLWGESARETPAKGKKSVKKATLSVLPFATTPEEWQSHFLPHFPDGAGSPTETLLIWLPTVSGQPVASSPLIAQPPEDLDKAELVAWKIEALPLPPAEIIDFLGLSFEQETFTPGVHFGKTLRYWATALRFAGALTTREQFLPVIVEEDGKFIARWKPILQGTDQAHFHQLAKAMPTACRAISPTAEVTPQQSRTAILSDFLAQVVDAIVREQNLQEVEKKPSRRAAKKAESFDSLHDQWLHRLQNPETPLTGTLQELNPLAEQVRVWQRPVAISQAAPFRFVFRLEEPPMDEEKLFAISDQWQVRYFLQAQDDLSLFIPLSEAWKPVESVAEAFQRRHFRPREFLLTSLGQAAGLAKEIDTSLSESQPTGFPLDSVGAHRFLTESAVVLEQAGFGVMLPAWWSRKGTKQKLTLQAHVKSPAMKGSSGLSLDQLLKFDWQVAIGDQTLTLQELETLARLKSPLVQVRGQWVQLSAEEIQAALEFWKKHKQDKATVRDLIQMALGAKDVADGIEVSSVQATGWMNDFLAQLQGRVPFAELPVPEGFRGILRPYQLRGYSWLQFLTQWGLGACLADDMGLGKTVQTLTLLQNRREAGENRPTLLICPMSVVGNWKKEAEKFTPNLSVLIHHGLKRTKGKTFTKEASQAGLVISSYSLLQRDQEQFQQVKWANIILDEAQNIKNSNTKQAQAARALQADGKIALTGTPVENHVGDLWSIWEFLNPGFLGKQA